VESDCLRCPFHGWGFNLDGTVRDVQGCKEHVPQKTRAETYVCVERNEMILLWLGGEADAPRRGRGAGKAAVADVPEWEVPVEACVQEYQFVGLVEHSVQAHVQEIPENGADGAHLLTVHAPFVVSQLTGWLDHDWNFTWTPGATEQDKHTAVVGMKLGMR
jgi:phenylpropionate dioxygenase-like ring-hydroxylating dioxygenase large terminal subunit